MAQDVLETGANRGLRCKRPLVQIGFQPWIPITKCVSQIVVECTSAYLEEQVRPALCPTHLLAFDHALANDLIDSRFHERCRDRLAIAVSSPKIWNCVLVDFNITYDEKPRRRLWELMKSQGLQENQQVVFMSDDGENVRRMQEYLHPFSEHLIDWFHITMRVTVLQQQTKGLKQERPQAGEDISKRLASVKHLLWHGNTPEALERLSNLIMDLSVIQARSPAAVEVADGVTEFETYIRITARSFRTSVSVDGKGNHQHRVRGIHG